MNNQSPLNWPAGWPRTQYPKWSKFKSGTIYLESKEIHRELSLMKATNIVINSDMRYRNDGLPYATQKVEDTGVAVYFKLNGEDQCIPCDRWSKLEDNLRAVAKTINAMRGIERWGAKEMVDAAFRGFKALPASIVTAPPHQEWYVVLDVSPDANTLEVKNAYRDMIKIHHPDAGGESLKFQAIQQAYKEWLEL